MDNKKEKKEPVKKTIKTHPKYFEKNVGMGTVLVRNVNYSGWGISYNN